MSKIWLVPIILSLSACTFGVPIGGAPGPVDDTVAVQKHNFAESLFAHRYCPFRRAVLIAAL